MPDPLPIEPLPPGVDPDILIHLNRLVAVEYNVGSAGAAPGLYGGTLVVWEPVAGLGALWCGIELTGTTTKGTAYSPGTMATFVMLFVHPIAGEFDSRYRLVELDKATLLPREPRRNLLVDGLPEDANGTGSHFIVRAIQEAI
jgi:hypothetical protein